MSRRPPSAVFLGKAVKKKKRLSIPVSQPEVPPKGAVFRVEYVSKEKPEYSKDYRNAERLFNNPDVRSVSLIGKTRVLSREEIMQFPENSAVRKRLKAEDEAKKAVKRAEEVRLAEARRIASSPEAVLGIKKGDRHLGKVKYKRTPAGIEANIPVYDYSVNPEQIISLFKKGLIEGIEKY